MPVIPAGALLPQAGWQLRPNDGQGLLTPYFANYIARRVEPWFYEFLREALPIIDAAIRRLVSLDGHIVVKGNNDALVDEIQEWIYNVTVNDIQKGLQAFHQSLTNEAFEQGFALGEWVVNEERTDITSLRTGDSKFIRFQRTPTGVNIFQKSDTDVTFRQLRREQLIYFSIDNENQNPYGWPLFRSCEFVAKILATMENSLANVWERFGDPSFSIIYKTSKKDGMDLEARRKTLQNDLNTAVRAKREGKSADFVRAIDTQSDIKLDIIGANGQILEFETPSRHILEQIIAKSGLPPWMLGMHWSSTQALAGVEVEVLMADIATRQAAKMPSFYNLVRQLLLLRGRTWKKGDWRLEWAQVNLRDIVKQAQARFMNAQADMYYLQNAAAAGITLTREDLSIGSKSPDQLMVHSEKIALPSHHRHSEKEVHRPTPWPALDKIEDAFQDRLKTDWSDLRRKVLTILKLPHQSTKQDDDVFSYTAEQRAAIMTAMKDFIGVYDVEDPDSPIRKYYGQAYSLGLAQAASMIGQDRPVLDIVKNAEVYDRLCRTGFTLVKNDATKAVVYKILPEMEGQALAGANPRHVATRLESLFDNANSDWERLARTEMTSAAEGAKLDEWGAEGTKRVEFVPAPDACDECLALAGDYEIEACPIPGTGTHPRCRCSTRPAET